MKNKLEKFSLKDELFNLKKVEMIATEIQEVYIDFDVRSFTNDVVQLFPELELKERIYHIRKMLRKYILEDYKESVDILLRALPPELDQTKSDDDFGDFIYAPYSDFVLSYGCDKENLYFSLNALGEITKRFSVEFAIRDFINNYPAQTLTMLSDCAKSANYHQRRLASEGLRMKLPWAKKLTIDYHQPLLHLELLYTDNTRYVTRSVANHLNDIAKVDAPLVLQTLSRWKSSKKQNSQEMDFIIKHALRTLSKNGDEKALAMLGYIKNPPIKVKSFMLKTPRVVVGEALEFEFEIVAMDEVKLMIDYKVHFCMKNTLLSPKVYKLKKLILKKDETIRVNKKHPFKANMSTRTFYAGEHLLEIQINGTVVHKEKFILEFFS